MSIFPALFFLFSIAACKKNEGHTSVSGTLQDFHNGNGIARAQVYLAYKSTGCSSCPPLHAIDSVITDHQGYFGFDFIPTVGTSYFLYAKANQYYSDLASGGVSLPSGKISSVIISLTPYGYLRIHALNASPFDWNDRIIFQGILGGSLTLYGQAVDTSFKQQVYGASINTLHYTVIKKNRPVAHSTGVYCSAFDTTQVQIDY